jgi:hypothetical protein
VRRATAIALLAGGALFPAALMWACGGDLPGPRICSERDPCDKGKTCVLGRCRKDKTMPISVDAPLLRFDPEDLAWLDGARAVGKSELGDRIVLGREGESSARLLMRFAVTMPPAARVQRALLELEPLPDCARRPGRMVVEVAHVLSPWRSAEVASPGPELGLPMRAAEVAITPAQRLRLDVTDVVKEWARHPKRYHGLALMASGDSPTGACYTTGLTNGSGPRLSIFLWPELPDAGADADADGGDEDEDGGTPHAGEYDAGRGRGR